MNGLLAVTALVAAVSETTNLDQTFDVSMHDAPVIEVDNVWGPVLIRTHSESTVIAKITEIRRARDVDQLSRSRSLIYLTVDEHANGVSLIVDGVVRQRNRRDPCPGCRVEYEFDLLVPENAAVDARTVMDGDVDIVNVRNVLSASNVNGHVSLEGVGACGEFSTVNGDIEVSFANPPPAGKDCAFDTINGEMIVALPEGSSADLAFQLSHGRIRSEFPVEPLRSVPKVEVTRGHTNRYQIELPAVVRIGDGGPVMSFESMNGDVLIKKQTR